MSYFDVSDVEGLDLGDSDEVSCIHGVDLFEPCAKCKPHAAISGKEDDVTDIKDPGDTYSIDEWIKGATTAELRAAIYAIEREVELRKAENAREAKALESFSKPRRATRSDKGTTRAPKAVKGNAEAKEGAA